MLKPVYTKHFAKDIKKAGKRGKNPEKFKIIAQTLLADEELDELQRDHNLTGNFSGRRECHIESDWLLIYKKVGKQVIFERTGTHFDLFKK